MIPLDTLTALHALLTGLIADIDKDFINGTFELSAGFFVINHCRVLYLHKEARGISMLSVIFFTVWGCCPPLAAALVRVNCEDMAVVKKTTRRTA